MIATTTLAVPGSAVALTGVASALGQTVPNPLNLQVNPGHVGYGRAVNVTGSGPVSAAGKGVVLETATGAGAPWRQLATTQIGGNGKFRFRVRPRHSGLMRAVEQTGTPTADVASKAGAPPSGGAAVPASTPRPVTVGARFAIARHRFAILGSGPVRVSGKLLPAGAGRPVRLQGHTPDGWRTLTRGRTGPSGRFMLRYRPSSGTGERLRVQFTGDGANASAVGAAGTVTVFTQSVASWYDDAGNTACGFHAGLGVANRTLPCGTKVDFHHGGRTVAAVVDDRGPYVGGRDWDLNQNTAAALGFAGVGTVWVSS